MTYSSHSTSVNSSRQNRGREGAKARHNKSPQEESAIARKAAQTRKEHDPDAFSKMGQKGAQARHAKSPEEESAIAKKAAETRKKNEPDAFKKMGKKGGQVQGGQKGARNKDKDRSDER